MLTCGQRDLRLGLATAKMNVVEIAWDRLIERRQLGVDEKVMMTGIRLGCSCRRDLHVLDPETDLDLGGDRRAVLEIDEDISWLSRPKAFSSERAARRLRFEHPGNYQKNNRGRGLQIDT